MLGTTGQRIRALSLGRGRCGLPASRSCDFSIGRVIAVAVTFGVLNAEQATAVNNVVAGKVVTLVIAVIAALLVLRHAEPQVTPASHPRAADGAHWYAASDMTAA